MRSMLLCFILLFSTLVYAQTETECLAEAIYWEARNQSTIGQIAVGQVIINRKKSIIFPNTICEVVHQPAQFSYYWDGLYETISSHPVEQQEWKTINQIAKVLLDTRINLPDYSKGAQYYHTVNVEPFWASKFIVTAKIEEHIFYKET